MLFSHNFARTLLATSCLVAVAGMSNGAMAAAATGIPTAADGIGGVVTGAKGPEAGVWVIAETHDLPTRFIKIVVTDDQGRFFLPELPIAKYDLFVRGYGLVDSKRVPGAPGKNQNLTAVVAPDAKAAAQYYPPNYWYSLLRVPAENDFPGTGPKGNGIAPGMRTQQLWLQQASNGCQTCHQMGTPATRYLTDNTPEGWAERITKSRSDGDQAIGNHGSDHAAAMGNGMTGFGRQRGLAMWADWTQRVEKGELPAEAPPRPQGIERNLVLTSYDWANGRYTHDVSGTDRHDPTVNAHGPVYGVSSMWGYVLALNPSNPETKEFGFKVNYNKDVEVLPPDKFPDAFPHNPMVDRHARLWVTDLGRYGAPRPGSAPYPDRMANCTDPANKFAKYWPQPGQTKNTTLVWDPKTQKLEGVPMCSGTHHLMFNSNRKDLYFTNGDQKVLGWLDIDAWDKTKDPAKTLGWCPMVLDTNSTSPSKRPGPDDVTITPDRTAWNQPTARARSGGVDGEEVGGAAAKVEIDPKKDTRVEGGLYGLDADISDGAMWFAKTGPFPSQFVRFHPGNNPPETCHTEMYEPPLLADGKTYQSFGVRGISSDSKGVAWGFTGNGQLSRFERAKCKVIAGPTAANGQQCPEGWSVFDSPGPRIQGANAASGTADFFYLGWVDWFDLIGLGKDTVVATGSNSDSLLAFNDTTKKFTTLRVPYPQGFRTRGVDGRIDDPTTGWKGKAGWATYSNTAVWHQEGGEDGTGPLLVKFQMRPHPLAN